MRACDVDVVLIDTDDVTCRVDPIGLSRESTGNIDVGEAAVGQQKSMRASRGVKITPYNISLGIDSESLGSTCRAGDIDGGEGVFVQQKPMLGSSGIEEGPHYIAFGVYSHWDASLGTGYVN